MKILLSGTTGYIGQRLLVALLKEGHQVVCCVRDRNRFDESQFNTDQLEVIEVNFLDKHTLSAIPQDVEAAYYLIHSMSSSSDHFEELEQTSAINFRDSLAPTRVAQVIYLSGIVNEENLSKHLQSRKVVEEVLATGHYHLTTLRAGIILGSGSASFEIIRDLVEKLPVMVAPRWLNTRSQPIAIRNVIEYLKGVLHLPFAYDKSFDIGGPEVLTYKELLQRFARVRGLKRRIITVPVMTPTLSSYWLYFVTSVSFPLATRLVKSMGVEVTCRQNSLRQQLNIKLLSCEEAVQLAFDKIQNDGVPSSWTDALPHNVLHAGYARVLDVPTYGCYVDQRKAPVSDVETTLRKIWSIGGENGWYYANWLWQLRGFLDKLFGGVGLRRGRKNYNSINTGDSLDFWRVLYASKKEKRLLLYAEMKLPGEAWLEFKIQDNVLHQTATFRPLGIWGRLYWYMVLPFHGYIFSGMLRALTF